MATNIATKKLAGPPKKKNRTVILQFPKPAKSRPRLTDKVKTTLVKEDKKLKRGIARATGDKAALAAHSLSHTQQITLKQVALSNEQTIFCGRDGVYALNIVTSRVLLKVKVPYRTMRCLWFSGLLTCPKNNMFVLTSLGRKAAQLVDVADDVALGLLKERNWEDDFNNYAEERHKKAQSKIYKPKKNRR